MKLFVAGLPYDLFDEELVEIFEKFGPLVSAKVAIDKETGKSKGFGFVEMQNDQDGKDAIEHLNDISLGKKPLVVKEAENRSSGSSGGGGYRGGGGSGGSGGGGYNRNNNRDRNRF
jgi:RNA recognition motif-containing protein